MHHNRPLAGVFVADDEGGYAQRDNEPGGAVNHGISMLAFSAWRTKQGKPTPTLGDLKALTTSEAAEIYAGAYFDPVGFDALPSGLDYVMGNTAIMQGVHGATSMFNQAKELSALDSTSLAVLLVQACAKLKSPGVGRFGPGWSDRFMRVAKRAAGMVGK